MEVDQLYTPLEAGCHKNQLIASHVALLDLDQEQAIENCFTSNEMECFPPQGV